MSNSADAFMARFVVFINSANENIGAELISDNARFFVPNQPEILIGLAGYMQIIAMMRSGFPDIQWLLKEIVTEQDTANPGSERIAARFTMRGTHQQYPPAEMRSPCRRSISTVWSMERSSRRRGSMIFWRS